MVNSVLNEGKSVIPPLFDDHESLSSASDKAKLFTEKFSKIANLDDWGISLPTFLSRTNLKLNNILKISKLVKKVITKIDWSKSGRSRVVSDRITRDFDRSGDLLAVVIDISNALDIVLHAGLLQRLKTYGTSAWVFGLISSFLSNRGHIHLYQEYSVNAGVAQGSILGPTLFLLYFNDLPDDVFRNIPIYTDNIPVVSKCDWASNFWQQLVLAFKLEFGLWQTLDWGRKWLLKFNARNFQFVLFYCSHNWCY